MNVHSYLLVSLGPVAFIYFVALLVLHISIPVKLTAPLFIDLYYSVLLQPPCLGVIQWVRNKSLPKVFAKPKRRALE